MAKYFLATKTIFEKTPAKVKPPRFTKKSVISTIQNHFHIITAPSQCSQSAKVNGSVLHLPNGAEIQEPHIGGSGFISARWKT